MLHVYKMTRFVCRAIVCPYVPVCLHDPFGGQIYATHVMCFARSCVAVLLWRERSELSDSIKY